MTVKKGKKRPLPGSQPLMSLLEGLIDDKQQNLEAARKVLDSIGETTFEPTFAVFEKLVTLLKEARTVDFAVTVSSGLFRILGMNCSLDCAIPFERGSKAELDEMKKIVDALRSGEPIPGHVKLMDRELRRDKTEDSVKQDMENLRHAHLSALQHLLDFYITCYERDALEPGRGSQRLAELFDDIYGERNWQDFIVAPIEAIAREDLNSFRVLQRFAFLVMDCRPFQASVLGVIKDKWSRLESKRNRQRYFEAMQHNLYKCHLIDLILNTSYDSGLTSSDHMSPDRSNPCHPYNIEHYYHRLRPFEGDEKDKWIEMVNLLILHFQAGMRLSHDVVKAVTKNISLYVQAFRPYVPPVLLATFQMMTSTSMQMTSAKCSTNKPLVEVGQELWHKQENKIVKCNVEKASLTSYSMSRDGKLVKLGEDEMRQLVKEQRHLLAMYEEEEAAKDLKMETNALEDHPLVGTEVLKEFPGYGIGIFVGKIRWVHEVTGYRIDYEDGDSEDVSHADFKKLQKKQPQLRKAYEKRSKDKASIDSLIGTIVYTRYKKTIRTGYVVSYDDNRKSFTIEYDDDCTDVMKQVDLEFLLRDKEKLKEEYNSMKTPKSPPTTKKRRRG